MLGRPLIALALLLGAGCGGGPVERDLLNSVKERGLIVGVRADNPPHGLVDQSGSIVGYDVDIATEIARRLGVDVRIVAVDELSRFSLLASGEIDAAFASVSHTWTRESGFDFTLSYFRSRQAILVRSPISSAQEVSNGVVAVSRGSSAETAWPLFCRSLGRGTECGIEPYDDKGLAVEAVRSGHVLGWVEDEEVLRSYAEGDPGLKVLDVTVAPKFDGAVVLENESDFRDALNRGLSEMARDGTLESIAARWFGEEFVSHNSPSSLFEQWPT